MASPSCAFKPANLNIFSCSQQISPRFLVIHMLCKKLFGKQQVFFFELAVLG
jgi:hypothetical protein